MGQEILYPFLWYYVTFSSIFRSHVTQRHNKMHSTRNSSSTVLLRTLKEETKYFLHVIRMINCWSGVHIAGDVEWHRSFHIHAIASLILQVEKLSQKLPDDVLKPNMYLSCSLFEILQILFEREKMSSLCKVSPGGEIEHSKNDEVGLFSPHNAAGKRGTLTMCLISAGAVKIFGAYNIF